MPRLRGWAKAASVAVVCVCAAVVVACNGDNTPTPSPYVGRLDPIAGQWTAYGSGTGIVGQLSNPFVIPTEASGKTINYVYTAPQGLAIGKTVTLNYSVTGPATFAPLPESGCGAGGCGVAAIRLFLWKLGDTGYAGGRLWCITNQTLVVGNGILSCKLDQTLWTVNSGSSSDLANMVANPYAMGFTFGGEFAGHGDWTTSGTATFKVNSFTVQ